MKKKCKRKHWKTGAAAANVIKETIHLCDQSDVQEDHQRDVMMPAYMALEALRTGELDSDGFITLNEFNLMTWEMGRQVAIHRANEESGETALLVKERTERVSEYLADLGIRWTNLGRFTARAEELDALRQCFQLCSALMALLPSGLVLQAMKDAKQGVIDAAERGSRAA